MWRPATRPRRLVSTVSILVDLSAQVPALPVRAGDVLATRSSSAVGGGRNMAAAAARLGVPTVVMGRHGTGPLGDAVRAALRADGITLAAPPDPAGDTGWCVVLVEPDGERTFVTAPGVEATLDAADLTRIPVAAHDAVLVSGYDLAYPGSGPALAGWVTSLPAGPLVVVDPGPLLEQVPPKRWAAVLGRTDVVTANEREADLLDAAGLLNPTRHRVLVRRRGADGAQVIVGADMTVVPAVPVTPVDLTGAGDAHVGAMIAGLVGGLDLAGAVALANRAAALAITRRGPATGPTRAELDAYPASSAAS
jgi:sugar/nucleoside kinase (ribokinase family)